MSKNEPLLPQKGATAAEIGDWIRNQIRSRRLVPGQRLVEVDIIRKTGGSRFKVREALQRLEGEGLVTIEEFRGASVRSASMEEVRQIYRARAALEGLCAADFTRKANKEQREELFGIAGEMERCVEMGTPESFGLLNARWHAMIMECSGNLVIRDLVQRLDTPVHHLVFETFYQSDHLKSAAADHSVIVEAIRANDPHAAEAAMRAHVENGLEFLRNLDSAFHFDTQSL
ncbi:GntR family transcriptional regulator [Altererythrobacter sp. CC-YST694]|uniref:GntR family transcriptional regulator n=1 Tax=Altererythrobacter sp. CC-YST694 TaxID=2755038 RepID=UPI001D00FD1A|nr:GntR family transcriptional regulator [Altererythrobacter sp. CC-YST694]MCB5425931.1 GntR family transcriptional regulator [Altererythrobacter sp. CC-YST694]